MLNNGDDGDDRHLLGRAVSNLLSNAVKYSDARKKDHAVVLVAVIALPTRVRIEVVDNGLGIPEASWQDIFKPFVQLHNPERDREKGVGLGLSIVSAIFHILADHSLELNSREGRGTRVSLVGPRAHDETWSATAKPGRGGERTIIEGLYALYVEDDQLVRRSTVAMLESSGMLCEAVGSWEEAAAVLPSLERIPDIVITDYRLPNGKTSADVVALVRAATEVEVPTVIITGEVALLSDPPPIARTTILAKPVAATDLLNAIHAMTT